MRPVIFVLTIVSAAYVSATHAHAIILLPAVILIPIVKIVAVVIAGASFPALGLGALWAKLFGKSLKRTLLVVLIVLAVLAIALGIGLKVMHPERPIL